jgi:superfamily II DNA or RNA helicase
MDPKSRMQTEALNSVINNNGSGVLSICTGGGKTKIAIDYSKHLYTDQSNFLWVTPTRKLRDRAIPDEFVKWQSQYVYERFQRFCYASINKITGQHFDLVVLDEGHNITPENSNFFKNNTVDRILLLSATVPKDSEKQRIIFNDLGLKVIYDLPLDKAVSLGIVSPYIINVIRVPLDNKVKYIEAGNKKTGTFYNTEYNQYQWYQKIINDLPIGTPIPKWLVNKRMNLIYNSLAKEQLSRIVMNQIPSNDRYLIFCGSIKQAEKLCEYTFHSKRNDSDYNDFVNQKINKLAVIDSLNEGDNIPLLDKSIIVQLKSNPAPLIQRIGRNIRLRDNHRAVIYILVAKDTQDEIWLESAINKIDSNNIKYFNYNGKL